MAVTLREKPQGSGTWWLFIHHKGIRKSKKIGTDVKIAQEVCEKVKAKLLLGELAVEKINNPCPKFKDYAEMWLKLPHDRKDSTQENYARYLKNHVYQHIGNMPLDRIGRKDFKLMLDKIATSGLKMSSIRTLKIPVNGIMDHAVDSELIDVNPLKAIKMRSDRIKHKVNPLTEKEASMLLDKITPIGVLFHAALLCLLRTGIRIGELQALTWADVDFENRLINIDKSWLRGRTTGTKTGKGRKVDMSGQLAGALRELKRFQWKKWAGKKVPSYCFAGPKGNVLCRTAFRTAVNEALEAAGLHRIRIHDLRHTYATIRLLKGHNAGDVSYQLGHSDIGTTYDVYTHWIPGRFKGEVDELDERPAAPQAHPETKLAQNNE